MTGSTPARAFAPGRVNLIGEHTDYTGGWCLPMAIDLGTTVDWEPDDSSGFIDVCSRQESPGARLALADLPTGERVRMVEPPWVRYVAASVALALPRTGGVLRIDSTLPIGAGVSSSTSLGIAVAVALGFEAPPLEFARACQRSEQQACGVPGGLLDQIAIIAATEHHALLLDCGRTTWRQVAIPEGATVFLVDSGEPRRLATSQYAARRADCDAAAARLGPLGAATLADLAMLDDARLVRRARHVITENARTVAAAAALEAGDLELAGALMNESHASLAEDFDVSTTSLDKLAATLRRVPGVVGARLTGAGFGGCVVALGEAGVALPAGLGTRSWQVRASAGASRIATGERHGH